MNDCFAAAARVYHLVVPGYKLRGIEAGETLMGENKLELFLRAADSYLYMGIVITTGGRNGGARILCRRHFVGSNRHTVTYK
jgi:hypothetical protein